ncbi:MAG: hypothetical protein L0213_02235 [Candidatus Dadabacteria bacterium]|nr:hypothetical protein [Candidatus Dadabacteria bacterium]
MDKNKFLECLAIYGGDIGRWPEEVREEAGKACAQSAELREALDQERRFEESLMERVYEEPSPGLEARIISAAAESKKPEVEGNSIFGILSAIFSAIPLPRPAIALPLLLVIGMAAGYLYANYAEQDADGTQFAEMLYYGEGYNE